MRMLNNDSAAAAMQNNFTKAFDDVKKELDVAVNYFVRTAGSVVDNVEHEEQKRPCVTPWTISKSWF